MKTKTKQTFSPKNLEEPQGWHIKVFSKVRKTQHQNPEFGPKAGEIQKRTLAEFHLVLGPSCPFPKRLHCFSTLYVWNKREYPLRCYSYFCCSHLYDYYNYSGTLCIKYWFFTISYPDLIKFHYFADLSQRGHRGWKDAQR
jgi:hypothetical protein